ncbi:MAG TPA: 3-phosphoshikimate 1-carboxyvinyltransferase [Cyclobacteriaceae bacterium]|nr:3-phosphoshikimate 1-carboxyvinyltransferase [Cyclobacteriaceae bacterium]
MTNILNSTVTLKSNPSIGGIVSQLPSSKSISNRVLIINALTSNRSAVSNLSSARDTKLMQSLVFSANHTIDVMDAGTTMRFLTAYFALTGQKKMLTGTDRMKQRPIQLLVDALKQLGAEITYRGEEGFPPIETLGFTFQKTAILSIPGNVSSQYISALMMLAPILPQGLTISLTGEIGSVPYITMTASLMRDFGATLDLDLLCRKISIKPGSYKPASVTVEADWSAASYWFAFTALAEKAAISLPNVSEKSLQGDRAVVEVMEKLGVASSFKNGRLELTKKNALAHLVWDFKNCPDLAQTVLPLCAAQGITGEFRGLESLRIKETDRIAALQNELGKIGSELSEPSTGNWKLQPGDVSRLKSPIQTYHDHRMAMGFAPWATLTDLVIESPEVVDKSYPGFWEDVKSVGIQLSMS